MVGCAVCGGIAWLVRGIMCREMWVGGTCCVCVGLCDVLER
jgi:hypothetical protein